MLIIIGTFEHSLELELLLGSLENNCISRKNIRVVPMESDPKNPFQYDSKKKDIKYKAAEVGISCATGFSVVGASVGFILPWGPVFCGLIASVLGFFVGFTVYSYLKKLKSYKNIPDKLPEVTVMVKCQEEQSVSITNMMWKYRALTVGKYKIIH